MTRLFPAIVWILFVAAAPAQTVYRCTAKDGTPVFSTDPCGVNAQKIEVQPASGTDRPQAQAVTAVGGATVADDDNADATCRRDAQEAAIPAGTHLVGAEAFRDRMQQTQQARFHSDPMYIKGQAQLAAANTGVEQARQLDENEARYRAEKLRGALAICDRLKELRAARRAGASGVAPARSPL